MSVEQEGVMSATDELRRLLDERGVKHLDIGGITEFTNGGGRICRTYMRPETLTVDVVMSAVLPEQAVEATLGRAYEPPVAARWDGDVLILTIPRDPSSIHVQRSESQPRKVYAEETKVIAATLGWQKGTSDGRA